MRPMAYTIDDLGSQIFGVNSSGKLSRSKVYALIKSGELISRKMGGKTIILHSDLEKYLGSLPVYTVSDAASIRASLSARGISQNQRD